MYLMLLVFKTGEHEWVEYTDVPKMLRHKEEWENDSDIERVQIGMFTDLDKKPVFSIEGCQTGRYYKAKYEVGKEKGEG